jgi:hypothetical protein
MIRPMPIPLHPSDNSGRRRPAQQKGAVIEGSGKLFDVSEKSFRSIQLDDTFYSAASADAMSEEQTVRSEVNGSLPLSGHRSSVVQDEIYDLQW